MRKQCKAHTHATHREYNAAKGEPQNGNERGCKHSKSNNVWRSHFVIAIWDLTVHNVAYEVDCIRRLRFIFSSVSIDKHNFVRIKAESNSECILPCVNIWTFFDEWYQNLNKYNFPAPPLWDSALAAHTFVQWAPLISWIVIIFHQFAVSVVVVIQIAEKLQIKLLRRAQLFGWSERKRAKPQTKARRKQHSTLLRSEQINCID